MGTGKGREFTGLVDCISKTAKRAGPMGLYQGFGVSVQVRGRMGGWCGHSVCVGQGSAEDSTIVCGSACSALAGTRLALHLLQLK